MESNRFNRKIDYTSKSIIIFSIHILILIAFGVFYFIYKDLITVKETLKALTVLLTLIYIWCFISWYILTKEIINIYLIFIIFSSIFFLGQPISILFDKDIQSFGVVTINRLPLYIVNTTLFYIATSILLIQFGAICSSFKRDVYERRHFVDYSKYMVKVGLFLLVISIIPLLSIISGNFKAIASGGYAAIFSTNNSLSNGIEGGYIRILANLFKPAILLLIIGNNLNKKKRRFWVLVAIIYVIIFYLIGIRGSNSLFLLSILMVYHYTVKPFSKKKKIFLTIYSFIFLIIMNFISVVRGISRKESGFWSEISEIAHDFIFENPFFSAISEFGTTLVAISLVFYATPNIFPYYNGISYFNSLISIIPNFFWDVHPAVAAGTMDSKFSPLITQYGGLGGSFISEIYYNFGYYGLILMPFIGYFLGKLFFSTIKEANNRNYLRIFVYIYISHIILWFIRSETQELLRTTTYYALIPAFLVYAFRHLSISK